MPRFNISITFSLATNIEPEGVRIHPDIDGAIDYEDSSYFSSSEITLDGGEINFTLDADTEEDARRIAEGTLYDGQEVEDDNGLTWGAEGVYIEVEQVEEPMNLAKATELVTAYLMDQELPEELKEAFRFLLARIA